MTFPSWKHVRDALGMVVIPAFAVAGMSLISLRASSAPTYPNKLIKLVVPLAAGGAPDVIARLTAPALSSRLGQTVIVENRPGGGSVIGTKVVATAAPDGYTLLFVGVNHTLAPALTKSLDYDPVNDFAPIGTVGSGSWVLVVPPSLPARSVKELVDYAKANPGKLNLGYGVNAGPQLVGEMFLLATGIDVARISYKSATQAIPDMLGGRIHLNFGTTANSLPLIQEGKLRALAVTSELRSSDLPDVPTMIESGLPHLTRSFWTGLLAPAGTPADIIHKLNAEINTSARSPEMKASMVKLGFEPKIGSPEDFSELIVEEIQVWKKIAKSAGIEPQ